MNLYSMKIIQQAGPGLRTAPSVLVKLRAVGAPRSRPPAIYSQATGDARGEASVRPQVTRTNGVPQAAGPVAMIKGFFNDIKTFPL